MLYAKFIERLSLKGRGRSLKICWRRAIPARWTCDSVGEGMSGDFRWMINIKFLAHGNLGLLFKVFSKIVFSVV